MISKTVLRTPDVILQAREHLLRGQQLPMGMLDASIDRSWQRCIEHGLQLGSLPELPRLDSGELRAQREMHRRLIELADPLIRRVTEDLRGCQLLLATPDATVLKSYGQRFVLNDRFHIGAGINLDERWFGTNAPALALIERAPVLVKSCEHLLFPDNPVSCVAAPLFDLNGDCLGLIDLTFEANHPRPEIFLRRVQQLTGALEQRLFFHHYQQRWVLQVHASLAELDGVSCGLVAMNDSGLILAVDSQAAQWLGEASVSLIGRHIEELLGNSWKEICRQCERCSVLLGLPLTGAQLVGRLNPPDQWQPAIFSGEATVMPASPEPFLSRGLEALVEDWPMALAREARRASRALEAGLPVLLQGKTGTGKEQLARALHSSLGEQRPFVALNCAALPESLIEAELFGYVEGAFTGARKGGYSGRLVQANGGTLMLDEIGDMPLALQARLLRVLQERVVTPLGDHREVPIDCRVIAASHRDLESLVTTGDFREDLFYRLAGVVVELPTLNEQADLAGQIRQHWAALCRQHGRSLALDESLLECLTAYLWPGNWRELIHCLEAALVGAEPECQRLTIERLSPRWQRKLAQPIESGVRNTVTSEDPGNGCQELREMERTHMVRTLEAHGGNMTAAARTLGISRSTLYRRLGEASP
ncbi:MULTISPECIES: sigma-54-dependent Fis family transcriptional regulator [Halomonadaceae]|uniref:Sigma-54-dependent Fis family transcriptional regulator n=1 Tax=Vreelandella alkaliphila TaxID=272774 RepID=A0AAJ2VTI2_9GAMM|nr:MULTISPECIES: sigma-54-dependent Fis family transcriptional regulator [Halomonas]MCD6005264.1 sigma-54-dependent Fis family transcriptional regulator [Halomonas sp. IOP_6]MDX5977635.1 sigma-54-dependent Fis family transcriptional regulator [Halomonas alkaliphila]